MKQGLLFKIIAISLFLAGCSGNQSGEEAPATDTPDVTENPVNRQDVFYINNQKNERIAEIVYGNETKVSYLNTEFRKSCNSADKCKYKSLDKSLVYEIKYKDDGFKLRDESGRLIWKIKVREDKIKIADNEEMENAFEIKRKGEKARISREDNQIGIVDFGSSSVPVLVEGEKDQYTITGVSKELASGVMAIEDISEDQRILMYAEIVKFPK